MAQTQTRTVATGSDGNLSFASVSSGVIPVGRFSSWNLNLGQVINNVTQFASDGNVWQSFVGGAKSATWGATASVIIDATPAGGASTQPFGIVSGTNGITDILPAGGCAATFTVASASIFTGLTACNIVWNVLVQSHGLGVDATGGTYQSLGGVCRGAPTTIAWDEA